MRWEGSNMDGVEAYEVRYGFDRWLDLKWTTASSETPCLRVELSPSTAYVAEVRAASPGGFGPWSARLKFRTSDVVLSCETRATSNDDVSSSESDDDGNAAAVDENRAVEYAEV